MAGKDIINATNDAIKEIPRIKFVRFIAIFFLELTFSLVLPFLRRNLGERYFSIALIFFMGGTVIFVTTWLGQEVISVYIYTMLMVILSSYHLITILLRNRRGEEWHSRHEGDFLPFFHYLPKSTYWIIQGVYEPLFIVIVGAIFSYVAGNPLLAGFFNMIAFFMVARNLHQYRMHRENLLDERDAKIEAENRMQALEGSSAKDTKGFVIKGAASFSGEEKQLIGKKILPSDEFENMFKADITISKDDMRNT